MPLRGWWFIFLQAKLLQQRGDVAHIRQHQALTGASGGHVNFACVVTHHLFALGIGDAQRLLFLKNVPQSDQKKQSGFLVQPRHSVS